MAELQARKQKISDEVNKKEKQRWDANLPKPSSPNNKRPGSRTRHNEGADVQMQSHIDTTGYKHQKKA